MENDTPHNSIGAFERAITEPDDKYYSLRLYIAGTTLYSIHALETIKKICEEHLQGRYELEVIDIYQRPGVTHQEHIVAVPTLIKRFPLPEQRIIGDMSKVQKVLASLDIVPKTSWN